LPPWSVPPVVVAQAQALRQPWPPPPLPTAAPPLPCTHQMPSDLLFHPRCETTKAPPGVTHRHVTDPAPQDRVDQRDHALEEVGLVPTAYRLPLPHPCRALLALGRIPRPPDALSAPHPPAVKAQAAALLPLSPVDDPAFLLLTGHLEGGQFLPEAFVSGLEEPVMLRRGLHHAPKISRAPRLLAGGGGTTTGDRFRPLQHLLHRGERQMPA